MLATSKLWRKTINEISHEFPDVKVNHLLVDACSMQLISQPTNFDVIVTENLFGDILSDEASTIPGSLGLSPSASFSLEGPRLYEPIHGSAPDIANQNLANPFGMILSLAMCLRESFNFEDAASELEQAVYQLIKDGKTTKDLNGHYTTSDIFNELKRIINKENAFMGQTLFDKVWNKHVLTGNEGEPQLLYIDLHLIHEVTSPQAFEGLRLQNRKLRRPDLTFATLDHNVPTIDIFNIKDEIANKQITTLQKNAKEFGVQLFDMGSVEQGIVHMVGPETGLTQPENNRLW